MVKGKKEKLADLETILKIAKNKHCIIRKSDNKVVEITQDYPEMLNTDYYTKRIETFVNEKIVDCLNDD